MKLIHTEYLIRNGDFAESSDWETIRSEIENAIRAVVHPPGASSFTIYKEAGKKRGQGSGVVPIKKAFLAALENVETEERRKWILEHDFPIVDGMRPGKIDALRRLTDRKPFAVEWETGNVSSSHRALNKLALGLVQGHLSGGALVLPTRELYKYLTDRIGNYREIAPYFPLWKKLCDENGVLAVFAVEHDATSTSVDRFQKGTDGRAIV